MYYFVYMLPKPRPQIHKLKNALRKTCCQEWGWKVYCLAKK